MSKKMQKKYKLPNGWRVTVRARIIKDGKLVIGKRRCSKNWTLPGGRPEASDFDLRAALAREVEEETGLIVFVEREVAKITIPEDKLIVMIYDCIPVGGKLGKVPRKWRNKPELSKSRGISSSDELDGMPMTMRQRQEIATALRWKRGESPIQNLAQTMDEHIFCGERNSPHFYL